MSEVSEATDSERDEREPDRSDESDDSDDESDERSDSEQHEREPEKSDESDEMRWIISLDLNLKLQNKRPSGKRKSWIRWRSTIRKSVTRKKI